MGSHDPEHKQRANYAFLQELFEVFFCCCCCCLQFCQAALLQSRMKNKTQKHLEVYEAFFKVLIKKRKSFPLDC